MLSHKNIGIRDSSGDGAGAADEAEHVGGYRADGDIPDAGVVAKGGDAGRKVQDAGPQHGLHQVDDLVGYGRGSPPVSSCPPSASRRRRPRPQRPPAGGAAPPK